MNALKEKLINGEIDVNGSELYFRSLIKALLYDMNNSLFIRGTDVPHIIVNTGDDAMYLAVKGQNASIEPIEVSNENYVYNKIPRAVVQPDSINLLFDQLTNPYSRGYFNIDYEEQTYTFLSEFRRMPLKMGVSVKYVLNSFTDSLELIQQIITKFSIIKNFSFTYLGQKINATYKISDSYDVEKQIEFDGLTTEAKTKNIAIEYEIESNIPIYYNSTIIGADEYISETPRMIVRTPGNIREGETNPVTLQQEAIKATVKSGVIPKFKDSNDETK